MTALPRGTVSILMSDVAASTARWDAGRDEAEKDLEALHVSIERAVAAHHGAIVKARGEGDSHFAAFHRPSDAVRAAADTQRCTQAANGMQVRIAVAMAELEPRDDDYVGAAVNRTARIRSTTHAGQIVCTRAVVDIAFPLAGLDARALGLFRVKDIPDAIELFQVRGEGLLDEFPPLKTLDNTTSALMAVVYVDQVGSSQRALTGDLDSWQGSLYRTLRLATHAYDGRHLKLLGDGGTVAFEDPRTAVAFAHDVCGRAEFQFRAGVAVGLVDVVEGELTGLPFYEAAVAGRKASRGEVELSPLLAALLGPAPGLGVPERAGDVEPVDGDACEAVAHRGDGALTP